MFAIIPLLLLPLIMIGAVFGYLHFHFLDLYAGQRHPEQRVD